MKVAAELRDAPGDPQRLVVIATALAGAYSVGYSEAAPELKNIAIEGGKDAFLKRGQD